MARKFQPQMATGNDLLEGDVVYFTVDRRLVARDRRRRAGGEPGGGGRPAAARLGVPEPGGRRLPGRGGDRRLRPRGAGAFPRGVPHPRALELSPARPAGGAFRCMTTPSSTGTSCATRVAEFRDQVERRIAGSLTEAEFLPLRLRNGLYLQLHAYMLRVAIPYGTLNSRKLRQLADDRRALGQGLRPLHHAAEHPVQLAEAARRAGHPRRAGRRRDARDPDQRQLHPQRDRRPFRRRRRRRDRGSAADGRAAAAVVDRPSGVPLPAAQVQDRHHRRAERPGRHEVARHRPQDGPRRRRRAGLRGHRSAAASAGRR